MWHTETVKYGPQTLLTECGNRGPDERLAQPSKKGTPQVVKQKMKKIMGKKKGISTILASLLLVVIVVVASVIVYAWATGLFGGLMPSSPSVKEGLSMDSYKWELGNPILYIRNVGTVDVTIESYYIEEAGQTKSGPTSCGVTIGVNKAEQISVTPTGFAWVPGHSYTVKLITSRGTQFAFTVIAA